MKQISYVYSNGVDKYFSRAIFFLPKTFYIYILVQNQIYICEIETLKICSKNGHTRNQPDRDQAQETSMTTRSA